MHNLMSVIRNLQRRADELGLHFKQPISETKLRKWATHTHESLHLELPEDYLGLMALSDGIETQRGWLYDAESFLTQNYRCWFCDARDMTGPNGYGIEFVPLEVPRKPEYAWLGAYGNMDKYIFDLASREYRATSLWSTDSVWFSSPDLIELLFYMAEIEAESGELDDGGKS